MGSRQKKLVEQALGADLEALLPENIALVGDDELDGAAPNVHQQTRRAVAERYGLAHARPDQLSFLPARNHLDADAGLGEHIRQKRRPVARHPHGAGRHGADVVLTHAVQVNFLPKRPERLDGAGLRGFGEAPVRDAAFAELDSRARADAHLRHGARRHRRDEQVERIGAHINEGEATRSH